MEDIFKFLVVAGAIAFGIFRQISKEKSRKSENSTPVPQPVYDEYEPEKPDVFKMPQPSETLQQPSRMTPTHAASRKQTSLEVTTPKEKAEIAESEYSIHSAEEARRAIIWAEIIQRKY